MLAPDTRLGPYIVRELLATGGMGEVYRGEDTRLQRDVAIKVLPFSLAGDHATLERFGREARAIASLSHPNILSIFDVGSDRGVHYAVTELLEGETLRDRLRRGILPAGEALELLLHIAEGVAAAHARGLIHRDLKPENIFLTRDGRVKILDFGLARDVGEMLGGRAEGVTAIRPTEPGTVLGTVGYLAPEQIEARTLSPATDVFALGCLLFEMLTGQLPFEGATAVHTLARVLSEPTPELPFAELPIAREAAAIVRRCLMKAPENRYPDGGELALAVRLVLGGAKLAEVPEQVGRTGTARRRAVPLLLAFVLLAAGIAVWWVLDRGRQLDHGYDVRTGDIRGDRATRRLVGLALAADAAGDRAKAIALLEEAHRRSQSAIPAAFLSSWYDGAGNAAAERRWAVHALERLTGGASPYESLLVRYLASTSDEVAPMLASANSVLEVRPQAWRLRLAVAHIHLLRRSEQAALRQLQMIDVRKPDDRRLTLVLSDRASLGDLDGAERDLKRSRLVRKPSLSRYTEARIAWSRGQTAKARRLFLQAAEAALAENQTTLEVDSRMYAATASLRLREWERARHDLARAGAAARGAGMILRGFDTAALAAYAAWRQGDLEERDRKLEEAQQSVSHPGDAASLRILAIRTKSDRWRSWPVPRTGSISILSGIAPLMEAVEAEARGDRAAAAALLRRARLEGVEATGLREDAEYLAFRLGEPYDVLRPDPPYPTILRYLPIFELEENLPRAMPP